MSGKHECPSCGATFETLTRKRLHQRDDCPEATAELDVEGLDLDEIAMATVRELLVCDLCGAKNGGGDGFRFDHTDAGLTFGITFTCEECGARNDNEGILS